MSLKAIFRPVEDIIKEFMNTLISTQMYLNTIALNYCPTLPATI